MGAKARDYPSTGRFVQRENPLQRVFDHLPAKALIDNLREHVRQTGMPDLWLWHHHTKPPKNSIPEIIADDIIVPESLRAAVGRAPCPICSPNGPKYFVGMLAWFPAEQVLRVIGHECGERYFQKGAFLAARKRYEVRKAAEATDDFLLNNLQLLSTARTVVEALLPVAREVDQVRMKLHKAMGKGASTAVYRDLRRNGRLSLFEDRKTTVVGRDGRERVEVQAEEVASFLIEGAGVLKPQAVSVEALLYAAREALDRVPGETDDEIFDAIARAGAPARKQFETAIRDAWEKVTKAQDALSEMRAFVSPSNVQRLCLWGEDRRSPIYVSCSVDTYGRLSVKAGKHTRYSLVAINRNLLETVVQIPNLNY